MENKKHYTNNTKKHKKIKEKLKERFQIVFTSTYDVYVNLN
jgi:hypothetical protein